MDSFNTISDCFVPEEQIKCLFILSTVKAIVVRQMTVIMLILLGDRQFAY